MAREVSRQKSSKKNVKKASPQFLLKYSYTECLCVFGSETWSGKLSSSMRSLLSNEFGDFLWNIGVCNWSCRPDALMSSPLPSEHVMLPVTYSDTTLRVVLRMYHSWQLSMPLFDCYFLYWKFYFHNTPCPTWYLNHVRSLIDIRCFSAVWQIIIVIYFWFTDEKF